MEAFRAEEVLDDRAKVAVLRPYLQRWKAEVGAFFEGVRPRLVRRRVGRHHAPPPRVPPRRPDRTRERRPQAPATEPAPVPAGGSARREQILDEAEALVEAEGLDALTMRRLAEAIGIRAPSLYKHVRDKAELEAALQERALLAIGATLRAATDPRHRQGPERPAGPGGRLPGPGP